MKRLVQTGLMLLLPWYFGTPAQAEQTRPSTDKSVLQKVEKSKLDRSGEKRKGKASYYSHKFAGKTMADGTPMKLESNVAASKTLPLGTKARVTNLENGKSAEVEIRDRGPYVAGRTVDLSPKTAKDLGITRRVLRRLKWPRSGCRRPMARWLPAKALAARDLTAGIHAFQGDLAHVSGKSATIRSSSC